MTEFPPYISMAPLKGKLGGRNLESPPSCGSLPSRDAASKDTTASMVTSSRRLPLPSLIIATLASVVTVGRTRGMYAVSLGKSHLSRAQKREVVPNDMKHVAERMGETSPEDMPKNVMPSVESMAYTTSVRKTVSKGIQCIYGLEPPKTGK